MSSVEPQSVYVLYIATGWTSGLGLKPEKTGKDAL